MFLISRELSKSTEDCTRYSSYTRSKTEERTAGVGSFNHFSFNLDGVVYGV